MSEKFSALGWNENTAAQENTMATVTRHEFTGHEGLDNDGLGMVNMNGRIYIPSGSQFLSADPHISDPTNTQNYNRYGYVNNNPLTYTDPTGFDECQHSRKCPGGDDSGGDSGGSGGDTGGETVDPGSNTLPADQPLPQPQPAPCDAACMALLQTVISTPINDQPVGPVPQPLPYFPDFGLPLGSMLPHANGTQNMAQSPKPLQPCLFRQGGCAVLPPQCFGSFAFAGQEADFGEGSAFVGAVVDSTVSGIDVGPLYEGAVGGEGPVGGLALTQSAATGSYSGFGFFGGSLSAGPLAGLQLGIIVSGDTFGVYFESHKGPFAGGSGYAISSCGSN